MAVQEMEARQVLILAKIDKGKGNDGKAGCTSGGSKAGKPGEGKGGGKQGGVVSDGGKAGDETTFPTIRTTTYQPSPTTNPSL